MVEGATALIAAQLLVPTIQLISRSQSRHHRVLTARFAAQSYACFFLSKAGLRPIAEFDIARHQTRNGGEYIANFFFVPMEKRALSPSSP